MGTYSKMSPSSCTNLNRQDCIQPLSFLRCLLHPPVNPFFDVISTCYHYVNITHCKGQGHPEEGHHHLGDTGAGPDLQFVSINQHQNPQKGEALVEENGTRYFTLDLHSQLQFYTLYNMK